MKYKILSKVKEWERIIWYVLNNLQGLWNEFTILTIWMMAERLGLAYQGLESIE
jgi:hypothetical protein